MMTKNCDTPIWRKMSDVQHPLAYEGEISQPTLVANTTADGVRYMA